MQQKMSMSDIDLNKRVTVTLVARPLVRVVLLEGPGLPMGRCVLFLNPLRRGEVLK